MRTRKPPEERQNEILNAAVKACSEKPHDKVSITEIAKSIGVSKAAIYFYYPSKDDLLRQVMLHSLSEPLEAMRNVRQQPLELGEKLTLMLSDSFELALFKPKPMSRLLNSNSDFALEVKRSHTKKSIALLRRVIEEALANNEIDLEPYNLSSLDAAKLLLSSAFGVARWFISGSKRS